MYLKRVMDKLKAFLLMQILHFVFQWGSNIKTKGLYLHIS